MTNEKIAEIEKAKPFKHCGRCGQTKAITEFRIDRQNTDGHYPLCKPCEKERTTERYQKRGKYFIDYRSGTKQRYFNWHQEYAENIKRDVLTHYGNGNCACVRCGFSDMRALSIDHINGDGAKHRKELSDNPEKRYTGLRMYKWIQDNKYPDGFRTLCLNCQFIVEFERRENKKQATLLTKGLLYGTNIK
jgi:hypothetical protein